MTPATQNLLVTLTISVFLPLVTLLLKSKIDIFKNKKDAENADKESDLDALREVRSNLETIKEQNNEIVTLSGQLVEKKNEIAQLQGKVTTIQKQLELTKAENTVLKDNITKMNDRIDALNKLVKGELN
jgi:peptidoglycan hydrolase CwlO-like protein